MGVGAWGVGWEGSLGLECQPSEFRIHWRSIEGAEWLVRAHPAEWLVLRMRLPRRGWASHPPFPRCLWRRDHSRSPWPVATANNLSSLSLSNCSEPFGAGRLRTMGCRQPWRPGPGPPGSPAQARSPRCWAGVWLWRGVPWAGGARRGKSEQCLGQGFLVT